MEDLRLLAADDGFCQVMVRVVLDGLPRSERRRIVRRCRKTERAVVPSASAMFRFLNGFHDEEKLADREPGRAWIAERTVALDGLFSVTRDLVAAVRRRSPERTATLDMDEILVGTHKREALPSYKGFRAYHPMNVWWAEPGLVVLSEFRDRNVPA